MEFTPPATAVLATRRLLMREMSLADLDFMADMLGDAEVMRYFVKPYTRAEAKELIQRQLEHYARHGYGRWVVLDKTKGTLLGQVGVALQLVDGREQPEVGYMIHRPYWRCGIATEAAVAARDFAFETLGERRVISLIRPENLPSQGVARKMGMRARGRTMHAGFEHLIFAVQRSERAT